MFDPRHADHYTVVDLRELAESVDALDLGSSAARHESSRLLFPTSYARVVKLINTWSLSLHASAYEFESRLSHQK